ncbi:MAG: ABC transporter ATP-binding protein [Fuerstiella sp.]|jgi:ABC-type multidrug transport system ATPase subunit|nr:ABC transporter ATP-binding protein [Fuerstiella sp.]MDG2131175.1 ABC transporter ATP-binding protein [Fuerstiella sp.]
MADVMWELNQVVLAGDTSNRVDGLSLTITGGVTAVIGYSGAGKTSLLNLLAGMEKPSSGVILTSIEGNNTGPQTAFSLPLYWVPQDGGLWPQLTARRHLEVVSAVHVRDPADSSHESREITDKLLGQFDLTHRQEAVPGGLSKGEQSRLSVARALAANPAVLLMDEPLAHVDSVRRPQYWAVIRKHLKRTGASLVFSTHEPEVVISEAGSVICLNEGRVMYTGLVTDLYDVPPDPQTAAFLGPANWFAADELSTWLPEYSAQDNYLCLRPESVEVSPDENGDIEILSFRFLGSYAETDLKHLSSLKEKKIVHRPSGNVHHAGQRVNLGNLS